MSKQKVVVVGLDGATWDLIDPLRREGRLPGFERLCRRGVRTTLESLPSTYTPLIWPTIATGKRYDRWNMTPPVLSRSDIGSLAIWDILEENGYSIGLTNWHVTWPPRETDGFYLPGEPSSSTETYPERYAYFKRLRQLRDGDEDGRSAGDALRTALQYLSTPPSRRTLVEGARFLAARRAYDREVGLAQRSILSQSVVTDVFLDLYSRHCPDFGAVYFNATDTAAHTAWKYYEPEQFPARSSTDTEYGHLVPRAYENADHCIRRILGAVDDKTTVVVVSDHGMGPSADGEDRLTPNVDALLAAYGREVPYSKLRDGVFFFFESASDRAEMRRWLDGLRADGTPVFATEAVRETVLRVAVAERPAPSETLSGTERPAGEFIDVNAFEGKWATHRPDGIFLAAGPGIRRGETVGKMGVTDVAPTLLHYLGFPVGEDMDGEVRRDLLTDDRRATEPEYVPSYDDQPYASKYLLDDDGDIEMSDRTERRLEDLGYI